MLAIAPTRSSWLDRAKGLCITLVVFGHVLRGDKSAGILTDSSLFEWTDSVIYGFHMPAFFFLAGITFYSSYKRNGTRSVAISAIRSILYPFVIWSLVQGAIHAWASDYTNFRTTWGSVLSLFTRPGGQFWFLHALFLMYLVTIVFLRRQRLYPIWVLLPVPASLYFLSPLLSHIFLYRFFANWVFFAMGIWVFAVGPRRWARVQPIPVSLLSVVLFVSIAIERGNVYRVGQTQIEDLVIALAGIALVLCLARSVEGRVGSVFELLGVFSLEIYLMHILAESGTRIALVYLFGITAPIVHLLVGTAVGIVVPLRIAVWLKGHGITWLFRFPGKKPQGNSAQETTVRR